VVDERDERAGEEEVEVDRTEVVVVVVNFSLIGVSGFGSSIKVGWGLP